ncbi:MAG: S-methyl-5'-thioadenosine phosphorylase [Candidatus Hadarchaeales archaeon]
MRAEIAVIGGSGFYEISNVQMRKFDIKTPYGIVIGVRIGEIGGKKIAFLARHGESHSIPPHRVNYRANIWALHSIGVERILATSACGAINRKFKPGDFILVTQFLDFTKSRPSTFFEGGKSGVAHIDVSEPFCPQLRKVVKSVAENLGFKIREGGVYACMEGPRFETPAEIRALEKLGADMVGMTLVPECVLARELGICYSSVAIITNYAAGISRNILTHSEVLEMMKKKNEEIKKIFLSVIQKLPGERNCSCPKSVEIFGHSSKNSS